MTAIKITPKGMKVKFSMFFFGGGGGLNFVTTPSVCGLSKGDNSNISGTVWCVKLKLTKACCAERGEGVKLTKKTFAS